jgi:hypothetical protein
VQVVLPRMLPASLGYFRADGAYLINNGQVLVLWLGRDVPQAWLSQVWCADTHTAAGLPVSAASQWQLCVPVMQWLG